MSSRFELQKTILENGLTLITERHKGFKSLSMGVWVNVGTRHELSDPGVCHFLEHMLFKGTKRRNALQIVKEVDQVGGEFNAFTTRDHTCFHLLLLKRDLDLGLDILSDILLNSSFKNAEVERERKVILQELAMCEEAPEEIAYDLFFEMTYGKHGLAQPILGTPASIKSMKRENIRHFFYNHYRPSNLVIAVAGDVTHRSVLGKIKALSKGVWPGRPNWAPRRQMRLLPSGRNAKFSGISTAAPQFNCSTWWVVRPTEQAHLVWGVPGPSYKALDRFAVFLLNAYLGGGMSSLLFQEIREKYALAYSVYSSLSPFVDSGVFSIYAATAPDQVPLCLRLIEKCVEKVRKNALSSKEMKLLKENVKGTILLSADSVESRMSSIARNEIFLGSGLSPERACRQIDLVTSFQLKAVAERLFGDSRSIVVLGPKPSKKNLAQLGATLVVR